MSKSKNILKNILSFIPLICVILLIFIFITGKLKSNFLVIGLLTLIPILDTVYETMVLIKNKEDNLIEKISNNVFLICCILNLFLSTTDLPCKDDFLLIFVVIILITKILPKPILWIKRKVCGNRK